jgi:hypothetical protein
VSTGEAFGDYLRGEGEIGETTCAAEVRGRSREIAVVGGRTTAGRCGGVAISAGFPSAEGERRDEVGWKEGWRGRDGRDGHVFLVFVVCPQEEDRRKKEESSLQDESILVTHGSRVVKGWCDVVLRGMVWGDGDDV